MNPPLLPPAKRKPHLTTILAVVAGLVVLFLFNPVEVRWLPGCVFHKVTGLHCPGCGGTRAVHHLLRGRLAEAWHYNAVITLAIPVTGLGWFWWRKASFKARSVVGWVVLGIVVTFGILRNLPYYPCTLFRP